MSVNQTKEKLLFIGIDGGGRVTALWVVNESGRTINVDIISENPKGYGFAKSVRQYLKNIRWEPATIKKVPVRQKITQDFSFDE